MSVLKAIIANREVDNTLRRATDRGGIWVGFGWDLGGRAALRNGGNEHAVGFSVLLCIEAGSWQVNRA